MAFPFTGILDAFTGAGPTAPPNANWSLLGGLTDDIRVFNNQVQAEGAGFGASYFNTATYGPDCEAYVTADDLPNTNNHLIVVLYARLANPGSATLQDGYLLRVQWKSAAADEWAIIRVDNNAQTTLGAVVTQDVADGDKIGFELIGSTLKGYIFTGGSWVEVLSRSDATYTAAGHLALGTQGQVVDLNNFGGGTLASDPPVNTVAPAVTGTPTEGSTLTTTNGTWDNVPTSYTYQWQRDTGGGMGNIGSATASTYVNAAADREADVRCVVTAINAAGSTPANSNTIADIGPLYSGALDAAGAELIGGEMTGSYSVPSGAGVFGSRQRIQIGIGIGL